MTFQRKQNAHSKECVKGIIWSLINVLDTNNGFLLSYRHSMPDRNIRVYTICTLHQGLQVLLHVLHTLTFLL